MLKESNVHVVTADDVARMLFQAAEDGEKGSQERFRYWVGPDHRDFVKAKYESRNDEEYIAFMRAAFP